LADDLSALARKMDEFADKISGQAMARTLSTIGVKAKADVGEAVRGDLGDMSMSNWRRGRPIQLSARFDVQGDDTIEVTPTPRARGPMRVLEQGRRAGVSRGTRRRRARPVSASAGKGTWSDASRLIAERTPRRVAAAVHDAMRATFRGG
jgi:hypothetical protein